MRALAQSLDGSCQRLLPLDPVGEELGNRERRRARIDDADQRQLRVTLLCEPGSQVQRHMALRAVVEADGDLPEPVALPVQAARSDRQGELATGQELSAAAADRSMTGAGLRS